MPNRDIILPVPDNNQFICEQDSDINGYVIKNTEGEQLYSVLAKKVTTRSHFRVLRGSEGNALASIVQGQLDQGYTIRDEYDNELASLELLSSNHLMLQVGEITYESKSNTRGKQFEFRDENDNITLTIDKKRLAFHDTYKIRFVENFPAIIAALVPVVIDDIFHLGTSN